MKYPFMMRTMHWLISIIAIGMLIVGFSMTSFLSEKPFTGQLYFWHKSFGVLILLLMCLRVYVRWQYRAQIPPLPFDMPTYERIAARTGHALLYLLLFVMPISGYIMSVTSPKSSGVSFFGLQLPNLLAKNPSLSGFCAELHEWTALALVALIVIHFLAVIKHRYFDGPNHDVLKKMV